MALFALLVALLLERIYSLGSHWQFEYWFERGVNKVTRTLEPTALFFQLLVLILPASLTCLLLQLSAGLLYSLLTPILWVVAVLLSIGCVHCRQQYKHYLLSVCHEDTQASYLIAAQLAEVEQLDVTEATSLGAQVGRQLVWINYRYYCATVLMLIIGGPVAVVFYASIRSYDLLVDRRVLPKVAVIKTLLFVIDWLPARLVALGYVLVGNFSNAISLWLSLLFKFKLPAPQLIGAVAMAAEQVTDVSCVQGVCMQTTCRLVALAKRNLLLLLGLVALMTIAGLLA